MRLPHPYRPEWACVDCPRRHDRTFCDIPDAPMRAFDAVKYSLLYPAGEILFVEGEEPSGVFLVCSGRVQVFSTSSEGRQQIVQLAGDGDLLGVSSVLGGKHHAATAQALEPSHLKFVKAADFVALARHWPEISFGVARLVCLAADDAMERARALGPSGPAAARVARFLLERCERDGRPDPQGVRVSLGLTHEQIGQVIGLSRETVSRTLSRFRREDLILLGRSTVLVRDKVALEEMALV
jgi:CRP/FNR family transcriptional regulator, cyclic AMP receptor protein